MEVMGNGFYPTEIRCKLKLKKIIATFFAKIQLLKFDRAA
jgi:hypothetical protein